MVDVEFVIPLTREDLLHSEPGQYVVAEVLTVEDILSRIKGSIESLFDEGPNIILNDFDVFYSCLCHFCNLESIHEDLWIALSKALAFVVTELNLLLGDQDEIDSDVRCRLLTTLKMTVYLLCQFIMLYEDNISSSATVISSVKEKRHGQKKLPKTTETFNWLDEKCRIISLMRNMSQLPIRQLWNPPVIEEDFINLVCNVCYKMLENTNINRVKELKESIFHLLGSMMKLSKCCIGTALKITQLLQQYEHLAIPLANAMMIFVKEYDIQNVLNNVIREIGNMTAKDLSEDNSGTRSFSAFLVEVAQRMPSLLLSNLSILAIHLDSEPYTMRNCILEIIGEILLHTMSGEKDMDERTRKLRDQLLDHLEDHIHDINAFVRSRSLQVWAKLFLEKAVPISRQQHLLEIVVGRLQDKACIVRKNAVSLFTVMLKSNPFAAKLSLQQLELNLQNEKAKLHDMYSLHKNSECHVDDSAAYEDRLQQWNKCEKSLKLYIEDILIEKRLTDATIKNKISLKVIREIQSCGEKRQFKKAVEVFIESQLVKDSEESGESLGQCQEEVDDDSHNGESVELQSNVLINAVLNPVKKLCTESGTRKSTGGLQDNSDIENLPGDVLKQKVTVQYLEDSLCFARVVAKALPMVCHLLGSSQVTDVLCAIEFFVLAFEFGVQDSVCGVQKMLMLIFSSEQSVKSAVIDAYKRLYMFGNHGDNKLRADSIVTNLLMLAKQSSLGQLVALEEMISEFVKAGEIKDDVFDVLWDRFSNSNGTFSVSDSNTAVILLGMAASSDIEIIQSHLQQLVTVGLGNRAKRNFKFARDVCVTLLKLSDSSKLSVESESPPFRLPMDHSLFSMLSDVLVTGIEHTGDVMWIPFSDQAVNVIYKLAEHPDIICEELITNVHKEIANLKKQQETNVVEKSLPYSVCCFPAVILARFLSLCGHVALCQMIHLDVNIFSELKRRRFQDVEAKRKAKEHTKKSRNRKRQSLSANSVLQQSKDKDALADDDDGSELNNAAEDDVEAEYIRDVCDKRLVTGNDLLLASIAPVIVSVASSPGQFNDPMLQAAASLALSKYMMVRCLKSGHLMFSSDFCEAHIQLLFTILERSPEATVRANTMVALGDLACRYPNVIEPWTSHLYGRLRDESFNVRHNAVIVLTRLILHDMVKVKGQISELALCTVDPDDRISGLAKHFFKELSQKANAIYNVLPDVISRLSDSDVGTTEENFQAVMKLLLPYIQKEKYMENMVDKLLQRFKTVRSERESRDLAFCIPFLCLSEKCYRKVFENLPYYADKLVEPKVFEHFIEVVANAKKNAKPDFRGFVEELEQKIEECHAKGVNDEAVFAKASQVLENVVKPKHVLRGQSSQRKTKSSRCVRTASRQKPTKASDESDTSVITKRHINTRSAAKSSTTKALKFEFSSDSDDYVTEKPALCRRAILIDDADDISDRENADPISQCRTTRSQTRLPRLTTQKEK